LDVNASPRFCIKGQFHSRDQKWEKELQLIFQSYLGGAAHDQKENFK